MNTPTLPDDIIPVVANALQEDIGSGDITAGLIAADTQGTARVICREHAVLCGTAWFDEAFRQVDKRITVTWQVADGAVIAPDQPLCSLDGPARSLLTGERTALNFLQALSGTATLARRYAEAVAGTRARVLDTRKTIPGLRRAQKYAVRCGGCHNHRMGLYDAILIKENHILAAGSIAAAVQQARHLTSTLTVEVEVESLAELKQALSAGADIVLLDNMTVDQIADAVKLTAGRARLEASGGITLDNIRNIAETGVDFISVGELTKHVRATDLSLRFLLTP